MSFKKSGNPVRQFGRQAAPTIDSDFNNQESFKQFYQDLEQLSSDPDDIVNFLNEQLKKRLAAKQSVIELVKAALREKYRSQFMYATIPPETNALAALILENVANERNKKSNPSVFIKLLSCLNTKLFEQTQIDQAVELSLSRLNTYISCDKNIFSLLINILKFKIDELDSAQRESFFKSIVNSLFLYTLELKNEVLRRDKEFIMNYISHFKILKFFLGSKELENSSAENQEGLILVTLNSLFLGSAMEEQAMKTILSIKQIESIQKSERSFYFSNKGSITRFRTGQL